MPNRNERSLFGNQQQGQGPPPQQPRNLFQQQVRQALQPATANPNANQPIGGTQLPTDQQDLIDLFRQSGTTATRFAGRDVTPFEQRANVQSGQFNALTLLSDLAFQNFIQQGGFSLSPSQSDYDLSNQIFGNLRQQATGNLMTGSDQLAQGLASEFAKRGLSGSGFEAGKGALLQRGLQDQLANILSGISAQQGQFLTQAPYRRNQQLFDQIMGPRNAVLNAATQSVLGYQSRQEEQGKFSVTSPYGGISFPT